MFSVKKWTQEEARKAGFTVDRGAPCVGYKGLRFTPTAMIDVYTSDEERLFRLLQRQSLYTAMWMLVAVGYSVWVHIVPLFR